MTAPWWQQRGLTVAVKSLLAEAEQHVLTHATVGGFVEMLQPPAVLAVLLGHLWERNKNQKNQKINLLTKKDAHVAELST